MMESSQGIAPCMQRFANAPVHLLGLRTKKWNPVSGLHLSENFCKPLPYCLPTGAY
jgi:hypothetical protein